MKNQLPLLAMMTVISLTSFAQQRIGLDFTSRLSDLTTTIHYQKVIKGNWLANTGLIFGKLGHAYIVNDTNLLINGYTIRSPYASVPTHYNNTTSINSFQLLQYDTRSNGIGIQFGLGYYKEFNVTHGLRFNLNSKFYFVHSKVSAGFYDKEYGYFVRTNFKQNYFVTSISPEIYHTIRLSGRSTFYYGLKLPYYFSLDKGKFNPKSNREILSGLEPGISVGMTYVIGKCD
jgi:hypothetical protein